MIFVEVMVNFKRPLLLKITILSILFSITWIAFGNLYFYHIGYSSWALKMPGSVLGASALNFFFLLYKSKIRNYVYAYGFLMVGVQFSQLFYMSYASDIHSTLYIPDPTNFIIAYKIIKLIFASTLLWFSVKILKKIIKKYPADNIYFNRLRQWSTFVFASFIIMIIGRGQDSFVTNDFLFSKSLSLVGYFMLVILIGYRPQFLNQSKDDFIFWDLFSRRDRKSISFEEFFENFFTQMYYLSLNASVEDYCSQQNQSPEEVNNLVKEKYSSTFSDLINSCRVNYFKVLVKRKKMGEYTLDALAQESGFKTRQNLHKSFKKFHGGNPSDFIKAIGI
jgi:AraC-like DNA-binding protein